MHLTNIVTRDCKRINSRDMMWPLHLKRRIGDQLTFSSKPPSETSLPLMDDGNSPKLKLNHTSACLATSYGHKRHKKKKSRRRFTSPSDTYWDLSEDYRRPNKLTRRERSRSRSGTPRL